MGYTEKNYVCACKVGFKGENCEIKGILTREGYLGHSGFQVTRMIEREKKSKPKKSLGLIQPKTKKIPRAKTKPSSEIQGQIVGAREKSKRAENNGTNKSKERREEPLGTMSYQTSSKRSPPFWLLIGARKLLCFSAQSEGRTAATVCNWSGNTLSPGGSSRRSLLFFVPFFSARFDFSLAPTICPWVSEDETKPK